jgi:two-component system C4-dicarboxylate transport sensor histidine kinase DctB
MRTVPAQNVRISTQMTRVARHWLLAALAVAATVAVLVLLGDRWSLARARAAADDAAIQAARTHRALLESELQKFRLLPLVLIEYPDVAAALTGGDGARDRLDRTLELLAERTDAADLYVIRPDGVTIAASNWRKPASFVGQNYGFRPYFRDAMRGGAAELFALGTVSRRPGLYLARRVDRGGRILGIVVVKVEFDAVESAWTRTSGVSFATDSNGVILVTSRPEWRFHAIGGVGAQVLAAARAARQFGSGAPLPAPLVLSGGDAVATTGDAETRYRVATEPASLAGGKLYHIAPLDGPLATARTQALLIGLGLLFLLAGSAVLALRAAERRRLQHEGRIALEQEVARRTAELRDTNERLVIESQERAEADRRYRAAREELAQASRLGTLGQITAGVAHEINQPVAAIRTFAESGGKLLDRGAGETARENFGRIVELTDRIGRITAELRDFARKRTRAAGAETLESILQGVLILIGERARGRLAIDVTAEMRGLTLKGERVRIEQILVNLIQNALDAIADRKDGMVRLSAERADGRVTLRVSDNGPGVDPAVRDTLFTPFTTAKSGGLGLGLAIARGIAREFGGELRHEPGEGGGARFLLTLPAA